MRQRTDVIFVYDGSFDGFLCCVYEYYYSDFNPVDIICEDDIDASFYQFVTIETDDVKAERVKTALKNTITADGLIFLQECMLCYGKDKEYHMFRYAVKSFEKKTDMRRFVNDEDSCWLMGANRHLKREKHLYLGLVRFYKANDVYISVIRPKNKIIPMLAHHFIQRFANQNFMIYDANNGQALLYDTKQAVIVEADSIELPEMDEDEKNMQKLWKLFYDTISIEERYNPKCRMNFMPKRTWDLLPEMKDL